MPGEFRQRAAVGVLACTITVAAALLSSLAGSPTRTAFANGSCGNSSPDLFDGYYDNQLQGWGSSAWIVTRSANWCTGSDPAGPLGSISAWSMVCDADCLTKDVHHNYAQSGYGRYQSDHLSGSNYKFFAEFTSVKCRSGKLGTCDVEAGSTTGGDNNQYFEIYSTESNEMEMWANDDRLVTSNYDPTVNDGTNNYWPGPWIHQYAGETNNAGDDVPGTSPGYEAAFTSVAYAPNYWNGSGDPSFTNVGDSPIDDMTNSTEPYYCFSNQGKSAFDIWTYDPVCL